jgi:hypothetical protein
MSVIYDMRTNSTTPGAPNLQATPQQIKTIISQNIAKVHRSTAERCRLAVEWIAGQLASVHRAQGESTLKAATASTFLAFYWKHATTVERDAFVRAHLASIWSAVDHATSS